MFEGKIVFISNFFNHHQKPLCDELYKKFGSQFLFVQVGFVPEERLKLKYPILDAPYLIKLNGKMTKFQEKEISLKSKVLICSLEFKKLLFLRKENGLFSLTYSERLFKSSLSYLKVFKRYHEYKKIDYKNNYLLCAGKYVYSDFKKFFCFKNRALNWGYFPETKEIYDLDKTIKEKKKNSILWCGRFLDWKRVNDIVKAAKILQSKGHPFSLTLIGEGPEKQNVINKIQKLGIKNIHVLDSVTPEQARLEMEKHQIFVLPSSKKEGWGAVINEAMNSACVVITNKKVGSAKVLIKNNVDGIICNTSNARQLSDKIVSVFNDEKSRISIGKNAYCKIREVWSPKVAALRLSEFITDRKVYNNGPCSMVFY